MAMARTPVRIHSFFDRHERRYCFFSLKGDENTFLYFSHKEKPLYSLVYGRDFLKSLPRLLENDSLCIECGLGLAIAGGIALDGNEAVDYGCSAEVANRTLHNLREQMGPEGSWIRFF